MKCTSLALEQEWNTTSPPQLNAVRSIRGNAKEKKEKIDRGLTRVMMIKPFFCLHF